MTACGKGPSADTLSPEGRGAATLGLSKNPTVGALQAGRKGGVESAIDVMA